MKKPHHRAAMCPKHEDTALSSTYSWTKKEGEPTKHNAISGYGYCRKCDKIYSVRVEPL